MPFFPQPGAVRILEQLVLQPAIAQKPHSVAQPVTAVGRRKRPPKIRARVVDMMHQPVELRSAGHPGRPILIQYRASWSDECFRKIVFLLTATHKPLRISSLVRP